MVEVVVDMQVLLRSATQPSQNPGVANQTMILLLKITTAIMADTGGTGTNYGGSAPSLRAGGPGIPNVYVWTWNTRIWCRWIYLGRYWKTVDATSSTKMV